MAEQNAHAIQWHAGQQKRGRERIAKPMRVPAFDTGKPK